MLINPTRIFLAPVGSVQITVESEDSGLWFDAKQRYTLRYGIG